MVKRDDLTGLAFGGKKARKLEYLMADALAQKADHIVTGAGFYSNWCTQTAAAARRPHGRGYKIWWLDPGRIARAHNGYRDLGASLPCDRGQELG